MNIQADVSDLSLAMRGHAAAGNTARAEELSGIIGNLFRATADGERETCTPEGFDCTAYFKRDWDRCFDAGGPEYWACSSTLIGCVAYDESGKATAMDATQTEAAFGAEWVRQVEAADAEVAE